MGKYFEEEPRQALNKLTHHLEIRTRGKGFYPFTRDAAGWVAFTKVETGLLTIFIQHTSASLVIQENADPDVVLDMADFFERLVRETIRATVTPSKARTTCPPTFARR